MVLKRKKKEMLLIIKCTFLLDYPEKIRMIFAGLQGRELNARLFYSLYAKDFASIGTKELRQISWHSRGDDFDE